MTTFTVHIMNTHFAASSEVEASNLQVVRSQALKGAIHMGQDEICKGSPFFGAEIRVECGEEVIDRMLVAIGASTLR